MSNFCSSCGKKMKPEMKFCPTCGRAREASETLRPWHRRPEIVGVAIFLVVCGLYLALRSDREPMRTTASPAAAATEIYSDSRVLQIASKFFCPCGDCKDDLASTCDCGMPGGATDVRKFIDGELRKGQSPDSVTAMVLSRFGHPAVSATGPML